MSYSKVVFDAEGGVSMHGLAHDALGELMIHARDTPTARRG